MATTEKEKCMYVNVCVYVCMRLHVCTNYPAGGTYVYKCKHKQKKKKNKTLKREPRELACTESHTIPVPDATNESNTEMTQKTNKNKKIS